ncbi:MAG: hypothetical protein AAB319_04990, partial [Pseudomonadota bacterium]
MTQPFQDPSGERSTQPPAAEGGIIPVAESRAIAEAQAEIQAERVLLVKAQQRAEEERRLAAQF